MDLVLDDYRAWVVRDRAGYSRNAPFHPSESYPELTRGPVSSSDNPACRCVRRLFQDMGLDADHRETSAWNPLRDLIEPGQTVVLKPNLVTHFNHGAVHGQSDTDSLVTHGSVVRAVADYAAKALESGGRLLICDCPLQDTDWAAVVRLSGLDAVTEYLRATYPRLQVDLIDYRLGTARVKKGRVVERFADESRRDHYEEVDLGVSSLLAPLALEGAAFGATQYSSRRMLAAHTPTINKYLLPRDVLEADVFINLPKLKTHMKTGITCALKNVVGVNGHKDYLPHFRYGSPRDGGDEYPDGNWWWDLTWRIVHREWEYDRGPLKSLLAFLARLCRGASPLIGGFDRQRYLLGGGSWSGNDTAWRMVLDINRALFYYVRETGCVGDEPRRDMTYMAIVDGLVAGEGAGPLSPSPVAAGCMAAGYNPVAVDAAMAAMMGFDPMCLRTIVGCFNLGELPLAPFPLDVVEIRERDAAYSIDAIPASARLRGFVPWTGFLNQIERRLPSTTEYSETKVRTENPRA